MPALMAVIGGNAKPLKREFKDVEAAAIRAGMMVNKNLNGGHLKTGAIREALVLLREIGNGNWTRVPGSLSILIQRLGFLKYLFNPITIGFVAVGTAAFFTIRHFITLARESKNLADLMDITRTKFSDQAELIKKSVEESAAFNDWLRTLGKSEQNLADHIQETIKAMREEFHLRKQLASEKGAGAHSLAGMDIDEARKELAYMEASKKAVHEQLLRDKRLATGAEHRANNPAQAGLLNNAASSAKEMGKIVDVLQEKIRQGERVGTTMTGLSGEVYASSKAADSSDVLAIKVGEKEYRLSLDEAKEKFKTLSDAEARLARLQKERADYVASLKKKGEKDAAEEHRLNKEIAEAKKDLALKQKYLPQIADGHMQAVHGTLTTLQQVGAFAPAATMVDIGKKQLHELKGIHSTLQKNGAAGGRDRTFGGVKH